MTKDEMVGWHHQLNGHEFEQALRDGEGQGGLACCSPRGHLALMHKNIYIRMLHTEVQQLSQTSVHDGHC